MKKLLVAALSLSISKFYVNFWRIIMRNILSVIFIVVATQGYADTKKYKDYQCNDMSNVIDYLLSTTPNIWSKLEQNPKNEKLALELSWTVDLAANYSTIYKAFCSVD
jgi:hypothetical protein